MLFFNVTGVYSEITNLFFQKQWFVSTFNINESVVFDKYFLWQYIGCSGSNKGAKLTKIVCFYNYDIPYDA